MIFDPALAAAARRHQRAKNKAQKSPIDVENTLSTSASNNSTSSASAGTAEGTDPHGNPAPLGAASATESVELDGSDEAKDPKVEEKAASSSSPGEEGSTAAVAAAGSVGAAGTLSRTANGSSNGVDFEGATARARAGGGSSRQRPMKPRVLLKIVVLGCSNVRIGVFSVVFFSGVSVLASFHVLLHTHDPPEFA